MDLVTSRGTNLCANYYPQQEKKFRQPPAHFLKMGKLSGIEAAAAYDLWAEQLTHTSETVRTIIEFDFYEVLPIQKTNS
ncbi:hypothetical protein X801_05261 [Opisthorchis viverrini]|uniref:Uncharacterized protein n=1 Tax=Opisthorchis viverrini TaxID=6198 RepID=A0A1S8WWH8_OPIVI|nr:hypothetical protein X801_05261 [Opisthorchis viverrini]